MSAGLFNGIQPGSDREQRVLRLQAEYPDRDGFMLLGEVKRAIEQADRVFVRVDIGNIGRRIEDVEMSREYARIMVIQLWDHIVHDDLTSEQEAWIPARMEFSDLFIGMQLGPRIEGT